MDSTDIYAALREHYSGFFQGHESSESTWTTGPLLQILPDFKVVAVAPGPKCNLWTYLSLGAWEIAHCPTHRHEFFIIAEEPDPSHVETLAMLTYYHRNHRLGLGHTLPNGRPWLPESTLDHFLISLPYTFGPDLEEFAFRDVEVQVLWALPITESEKRFRHDKGLEDLEVLFEENELDYWNPLRAPVVPQ